MTATGDIRNVVLLGHGGSGKTSITEAILHTTGAINRLGSVDDKTTVSDYYDEEKEHQHSILASIVHTQHNGKLINVIDTPGYPDFIGPAIVAIPAAETAILVIGAASGIETNTRKFFHLTSEANKPRVIVINKMDAENVEFPELIATIQETFGSQCRCANLPAADKNSVIDCIENSTGSSPVMDVAEAHTQLIESVIEADDALMERYLGGEEIQAGADRRGVCQSPQGRHAHPDRLYGRPPRDRHQGAARPDRQIHAVAGRCRAGQARGRREGDRAEGRSQRTAGGPGLPRRLRPAIQHEVLEHPRLQRHAQVRYQPDAQRREERASGPGHILKSQGGEIQEIDVGLAGDIVTLAKIEELKIGDLVHDGRVSGKFQMPAAARADVRPGAGAGLPRRRAEDRRRPRPAPRRGPLLPHHPRRARPRNWSPRVWATCTCGS